MPAALGDPQLSPILAGFDPEVRLALMSDVSKKVCGYKEKPKEKEAKWIELWLVGVKWISSQNPLLDCGDGQTFVFRTNGPCDLLISLEFFIRVENDTIVSSLKNFLEL